MSETQGHLLDKLRAGSGLFTQQALEAVDPQLATLASTLSPIVAVTLPSGSARLIVMVPDEGPKVVYSGQVNEALGEACGRFVESALADVSDEIRSRVVTLTAAGASLGVMISRDTDDAALIVDDGTTEPVTVATLEAQGGTRH